MQRLGAFFARVALRHLPDPLALAVGLTLLVGLVALIFPNTDALRAAALPARAAALIGIWLDGVWNAAFLAFALQMCVVLLAGFALAHAPPALRGLRRLAALPRSNRGAVTLIAAVSCVGCWINWGFGLMLAGMLAIEVRTSLARRKVGCQYPLIVAAAFTGMMVWHGGLSGSAPLKVAEIGVPAPPAHVAITAGASSPVADAGALRSIPPISVEHTLFSRANLMLSAVLLVGVPLVLRALAARKVPADVVPLSSAQVANCGATNSAAGGAEIGPGVAAGVLMGWAQRLDASRIVNLVLGLLLIAGVGVQIQSELRSGEVGLGLAIMRTLDLNVVNSLFLAAGLLLHPSIASYVAAVTEGGRAIVGIVVQFPLYSGLQALMFGGGLAATMSEAFVQGAQGVSATLGIPISATFPLATFLSACLVNFFVPSGGGQWIVQGPVMCAAADTLGLSLPQTVMAVAYGDDVTNMVQPFWAIPLMGLTGVDVRAFMGYTALLMLLAAPVFAVALLLY